MTLCVVATNIFGALQILQHNTQCLKQGLEIGRPFIKSRNISLDSPLEMYSKFVLAYQIWSVKS